MKDVPLHYVDVCAIATGASCFVHRFIHVDPHYHCRAVIGKELAKAPTSAASIENGGSLDIMLGDTHSVAHQYPVFLAGTTEKRVAFEFPSVMSVPFKAESSRHVLELVFL